jgi:hypothetical protein
MQTFLAKWSEDRYVKWRSLSWKEFDYYQNLLTYLPPAEVYCQVYKLVLIEGPKLDGHPVHRATAGIVDWIARSLLEHNPFNGLYEDVKRAYDIKKKELNYLSEVKAIIASIFRYTFEEIESWDAETLYERIVAAEFVTGKSLEPPMPESMKKEKGVQGKQIREPVKLQKQISNAQQLVRDRVAANR